MSKTIMRKEIRSFRQSTTEDDTRSHLRQFLTTIKKHQSPLPKRSISLSLNFSPTYLGSTGSPNDKANVKCSLPIIAPKRKIIKNPGVNQFEQHIINNYLNAHLKVSKTSKIQQKVVPKIKKKKKGAKAKPREVTNHTTIQQAELQTHREGDRSLGKSATSRKDYSLKEEPMKHYVIEKIERKKRQWKEKGPLELVTFFYQLGPHKRRQESNRLQSNPKNQNNINIKLPKIQNIPHFIKTYIPINKKIRIVELIRQQTFTVFQDAGFLYFGEASQDKKNGLGVLIMENYLFQGSWKDNMKHQGVQKNLIGTYRGTFVNGKKEGKGEFKWHQGEFYSGEWKNGKKHGVGLWSSPNGDNYMGEWKHGIVEGEGVHKCSSGQRYQGSFKNFLKHGYGKQNFPNKDFYEGLYLFGLPHGKGHYIWQSGTEYQGDFVQGVRHGTGTLKSPKGFFFTGKFVQEFAEGNCQINYGNGQFYIGQIKRGKRNGKGILKNTLQRKVFEGFWKNDEFDAPDQH